MLPVKQEFGKISIIIAVDYLNPVTLIVALTLLSTLSNHACSPYFWHMCAGVRSVFLGYNCFH